MHFRWRTNPTVIAQYMTDAAIPRKSEVTLKPNEVCVVLENGKIVGSVSQQHMEVNPEIGLFSKIFGRTNPIRSFMFAFTGPHTILVQVRGIAENGDEINCLVSVKVGITRESATRLITFPAKGKMMIQAKEIAELISPAVSSTTLQHLHGLNSHEMRTVKVNDDVMFGVKSALRNTLDEHGLVFINGFITWSSTAAEQQLQQQHDLERLQNNLDYESEQQAIELDNLIKNEQRKHEVNARMALVGVQATEAAEMKLELERLEKTGVFNLQKWKQEQKLRDSQAQSARENAIKDAEANVEVAKLEAERQNVLRSVEKEAAQDKMDKAMQMFEQVQARKRDRMELNKEHEQQRLDMHNKASQSSIEVLEKIASTSDDPMVQMEALKQLAELRKADVAGQKDAYKNDG